MKESLPVGRLLPETLSILSEVEGATGKPLELKADRSIWHNARATVRIAGKDSRSHVLLYDPRYETDLDYLVAHEAGHLLRLWEVPESERKTLVSTRECQKIALTQIYEEVEEQLRRGLPQKHLGEIFQLWMHGLVSQMVNTPADMRIEVWLHQSFPGLKVQQRRSLRSLAFACHKALSPKVKYLTPPTIFDASNHMNYAFCRMAASLLRDGELIRLFATTKYPSLGKKMYAIVAETPDTGYPGDWAAADLWAKLLRLEGWYQWMNLQAAQSLPRPSWCLAYGSATDPLAWSSGGIL